MLKLSFNKNKNTVSTFEELMNFMKFNNRELNLDILTPQIAQQIDEKIRYWNILDEELNISLSKREPIKIYINSIGGSLDAAMTIMNAIQISKTPIYTFNIGSVYRESFLVYIAGHKRFSYQNSLFMYTHSIYAEPNEENNEATFYNKNMLLKSIQNEMRLYITDRIGISQSQYDRYNKNEWWFSSEEAFNLHICNEIPKNHYYCINNNL